MLKCFQQPSKQRNLMIKKVLIATVSTGIVLTSLVGCSKGSANSLSSKSGRQEIWLPYFEKTGSGHCASTDGNWEYNATIALVGPDDSVLSSTTLDYGHLGTTFIDKSRLNSMPDGKVCLFDFEFPDVPVAETYRLKTKDGRISTVVFQKDDFLSQVIGADFKR